VSGLLSELARVKAIFQQRAILAHIGSPLAPPPDASSRSARQTDHSPTEAVKDGRPTRGESDE